ncbi:hypothetical protein WNB94_16955 [Aquabacterium sp. A3]|uniref:hypothetical protein n=1 Tax=Aquabacterium sp. A3 TaxID=3132829 RepID=UPI0031193433
MDFRIPRIYVATLPMLLASFCIAAETYDEAEQKSLGHSTNAAEVEWYETQMLPAFRKILVSATPNCLKAIGEDRPARVDFVFIVQAAGTVSTVLWKEESAFSKCLQPAIVSAKYPEPLNKSFYFGVGFRLPPKRPT